MTGVVLTAGLSAIGFVLLYGAAGKRRGSLSQRLPAALEAGVAAIALVGPPALGAALAAVVFGGFSGVHLRSMKTGRDCGCLGESRAVAPVRRAALTGLTAILAAALALGGPTALVSLVVRQPSSGLLAGAAAAVISAAWLALFRAPSLSIAGADQALIVGSAQLLERRVSRRDALVRLAVAGSALVVAPLRYLLYPVSALAAIVPGDCSSGLCTDGYTAFCCEIQGGLNTCPENTYPAGWWMCTDYAGRQLCSEQGVRYYVDCNRIPGRTFPGGCRCAEDSCDHRRVACNVFRYGQCNTQVPGITEVVCRMVVCQNPSTIPALNCSASLAVDDAVCAHDVPCLEPPAVELVGAGGV